MLKCAPSSALNQQVALEPLLRSPCSPCTFLSVHVPFSSASNDYQFVVSKAFLSTRLAVSRWMIVHCHRQVSPTAPRHECACFFYGIYSFNSLERHVISCISLLPRLGRCFAVRSLHACVCGVLYLSLAGGSSVWKTAK